MFMSNILCHSHILCFLIFTMFGLVLYEDGIYHVTKRQNIFYSKTEKQARVKYKDGKRYNAQVICVNDSKQTLIKLAESLQTGTPYICLTRIPIEQNASSSDYTEDDDDSVLDKNYIPDDFELSQSACGENTGNCMDISCEIEEDYNKSLSESDIDIYSLDNSYREQGTGLSTKKSSNENLDLQPSTSRQSMHMLLDKIKTYSPPKNDEPVKISHIPDSKSNVKKYFCIYCKKLFSKLPNHLQSVHHEEEDVRKFLLLPKRCRERMRIIDTIRKRGCFLFNSNNLYNDGHLIVSRRPTVGSKKSDNDYKTCPSCKGFFSKWTIRKHFPKCIPNWEKGDRSVYILGKRVHGKVHENACQTLKNMIFPKLREDEITRIIRYDDLVIAYGNALCVKYRLEHLHTMIRSKLRLLGRFLIEIKKIDPSIADFSSCFSPDQFDNVVNGVNRVAGLDASAQLYKSPSTAFEMGSLLKKCGKLLITLCIKSRNEKKKYDVQDFLKILEEELSTCINKTVMENQLQQQRKKKNVLPANRDVEKFYEYLNRNIEKLYKKLYKSYDFVTWKQLASFILISVQTFNRRRAGEVERIIIDDFQNYESVKHNNDTFLNLPDDYNKNANKYVRFVIRGKKGRGVPVLLYKDIFKCIQLLLKYRLRAGVSEENPYLFGMPSISNTHHHLDACALMRRFAEESGVYNPKLLRGTQLRKHMATKSALLNLQETEVSDLANFMGHADKIHRDHYRIPVVSREIGRISKLLEIGVGERTSDYQNPTNLTCSDEADDSFQNSHMDCARKNNSCSDSHETPPRDSWTEDSLYTTYGKSRCVSPYGKVHRRSWNTPEKSLANNLFSDEIQRNEIPSLSACTVAIKTHLILKDRTPTQLKSWVANQINNKNVKKSTSKVYWTSEEKGVMETVFSKYLTDNILPGLKYCEMVRQQYPILKSRTAVTMKAWVNNYLKKQGKKKINVSKCAI